jgi:hypothetical protein
MGEHLPSFAEYLTERTGPIRIVLVGGPKGGKSTLLDRIDKRHSNKFILLPEVATAIMKAGLTRPPEDESRIDTWLTRLQPSVMFMQMLMEREAYDDAVSQNLVGFIADRGTADAVVYLPGRHDELATLFPGLTNLHLHGAYDMVIHLESLATARPELFDDEGNDTRYEKGDSGLQRAIRVEHASRDAWEKHPNYHFFPGDRGIEATIQGVFALLDPLFT